MDDGSIEDFDNEMLPPEQGEDMGMETQNPELDELMNQLEEHPDLIDMTKKYVDGMVKSRGGEEDNQNMDMEQPPMQESIQQDINIDEIVDEILRNKNSKVNKEENKGLKNRMFKPLSK